MLEDLKTLLWFLKKGPKFYATMFTIIFRKFRTNRDREAHIKQEKEWCKVNKISLDDCLSKLEFSPSNESVFSDEYIKKIERKISDSHSNFGGQGHVNLLYAICENLKAERVLETGVAYGWSSAAILKSISKRSGNLVSVDMPMIKQTDYHLIGTAVEKKYFQYWELLRQPDKFGLIKAIKKLNHKLDLAHYDSDKSYYGRRWSQPIIWKYIRKGGVFISDDIEDNAAFREFVTKRELDFSVLEFEGKYVGVLQKN